MRTYFKYLLLSFLVLFTAIAEAQLNSDKFVVVLDAGHGGKDPGRPTKFELEKNVALKVVLEIGKELEKQPHVEVIYTRTTDVFLELRERAAIANKADADLFVSIHCNAHNTQAFGTETYVLSVGNTERNFEIAKAENEVIFLEEDYEVHYEGYDPNSPESNIAISVMQEEFVEQSIILADMVENNFKNKLKRKSRGVKQISLWVMHNTYMPSVLIETGFLTNRNEGKYLSTNKGQKEISGAITDAVLKYKEQLYPNFGDVVLTQETISGSSTSNAAKINTDITFKVQIAASKRKVVTKPYNFNGLKAVERINNGNVYKYFYGQSSNHENIKTLQQEARRKGYPSAFIVAFKGGEQISLEEALKSSSE